MKQIDQYPRGFLLALGSGPELDRLVWELTQPNCPRLDSHVMSSQFAEYAMSALESWRRHGRVLAWEVKSPYPGQPLYRVDLYTASLAIPSYKIEAQTFPLAACRAIVLSAWDLAQVKAEMDAKAAEPASV